MKIGGNDVSYDPFHFFRKTNVNNVHILPGFSFGTILDKMARIMGNTEASRIPTA